MVPHMIYQGDKKTGLIAEDETGRFYFRSVPRSFIIRMCDCLNVDSDILAYLLQMDVGEIRYYVREEGMTYSTTVGKLMDKGALSKFGGRESYMMSRDDWDRVEGRHEYTPTDYAVSVT